jgi:methylated-DNA-protein-cysteine methyltransferase-like protein
MSRDETYLSGRARGAERTYSPDEYAEAVLTLVERIPPGTVMSYGAIADALADTYGRNSPRRVGTIMATHGASVPWWRVGGAGGKLPTGHEAEARRRLEAEGATFRGDRVVS